MSLKITLLSTAFLIVAGPALAQTAPGTPPSPPQRGGGFERLDTNNDGVITRDEVRAVRTATFTRLDTNRDGSLDRAELTAGRPDAMRDGPQGRTKNMQGRGEGRGGEFLTRADTNNDGNISRAEFDQAISAMQRDKAARGAQQRTAMFERLDANRDGMITRAEADAARAQMEQRRPPQDPEGMGAAGRRMGERPGMTNPDADNDGKITLAEWLARPDPMFDRGDTNNDGRLTREEAAAATRAGRGEGRRPTRPW
jgi:Ca2+-binding EF-hand superfamily protein